MRHDDLVSIREETKCERLENSPVLSVWSGKKGSEMTTELMSYFLLSLAYISHRHISRFLVRSLASKQAFSRSSSAVTYLPSFPLRPIFIYLYPGAPVLWLLPKNIYFLFQPAWPYSSGRPMSEMIISTK